MDIVPRPEMYPGHCIATLTDDDPLGFVDVGLTPAVVDPKVYVSVTWIGECARKLGFLDQADADDLRAALQTAENRALDLEQELEEADKFQEAVHVLKRHGLNPQRKPGRPVKKAA